MVSVNGERVSCTAKTKAECQRWIRKMLHQLDLDWDYDGGQAPLEQYLYQWLDAHKVTLRDHTTHRYKQVIDKHIVPHLGDVELKDLHLARVE